MPMSASIGASQPSARMIAQSQRNDPRRRSYSAGRTAQYEPLYDIDPSTGATIEVFYAEPALAKCFGMCGAGWLWWTCHRGSGRVTQPAGPFGTPYAAYRDAVGGRDRLFAK